MLISLESVLTCYFQKNFDDVFTSNNNKKDLVNNSYK